MPKLTNTHQCTYHQNSCQPNHSWLPRSHTARASDNLLKNKGLGVKVEQAEKLARGYEATSVDH